VWKRLMGADPYPLIDGAAQRMSQGLQRTEIVFGGSPDRSERRSSSGSKPAQTDPEDDLVFWSGCQPETLQLAESVKSQCYNNLGTESVIDSRGSIR